MLLLRRGEESAQRQRHLLPPTTVLCDQRCPARVMPSIGIPPDGLLAWWDEKHTRFLRLREFVWVSGCLTAPAAWTSPPRQRGPHRQAATQECTQIGGNGPSAQFWGIRVHYCDARIARVAVGTKECTQIGGNGPSAQFLGHSCTLLRREPRRVARVPRPPWCAGGAPSVAASPLVGKTGSARAPPLAWRLRRGSNPHKPPRSHFLAPKVQCSRHLGPIQTR